jgi:hypothetical protein
MPRPKEMFRIYNSRYFNGSLPDCTIRWEDLKIFGRYYPIRERSEKFPNVVFVEHVIELARWSQNKPRQWKLTLLHEMVHLKQWREKGNPHGHKFQREMKRLAGVGAFNRLW